MCFAHNRHRHSKKEIVNVEFVSANPTGPLHLGHLRGANFLPSSNCCLLVSSKDFLLEHSLPNRALAQYPAARWQWGILCNQQKLIGKTIMHFYFCQKNERKINWNFKLQMLKSGMMLSGLAFIIAILSGGVGFAPFIPLSAIRCLAAGECCLP